MCSRYPRAGPALTVAVALLLSLFVSFPERGQSRPPRTPTRGHIGLEEATQGKPHPWVRVS